MEMLEEFQKCRGRKSMHSALRTFSSIYRSLLGKRLDKRRNLHFESKHCCLSTVLDKYLLKQRMRLLKDSDCFRVKGTGIVSHGFPSLPESFA